MHTAALQERTQHPGRRTERAASRTFCAGTVHGRLGDGLGVDALARLEGVVLDDVSPAGTTIYLYHK